MADKKTPTYFDYDRHQYEYRKPNSIEKRRVSDIIDAINKAFAKHYHLDGYDGNKVDGFTPFYGSCECGRPITLYVIRLKKLALSMEEIRDIKETLDRSKMCLVMELRDDSKTTFDETIGFSTYCDIRPNVLSYVSIFENIWLQTEMYEKVKDAERMQKVYRYSSS